MQAKMERVESEREAERAEREAEQQRMAEILQYMQSLGAATGVLPPPSLFAPPPPPQNSTPVSINVLVCMFMLTVKPSEV